MLGRRRCACGGRRPRSRAERRGDNVSSCIQGAVMKFGQIMRDEQKLCLVGAQIEMFDFFVGKPLPDVPVLPAARSFVDSRPRLETRFSPRRRGAVRCPVMTSSCLPRPFLARVNRLQASEEAAAASGRRAEAQGPVRLRHTGARARLPREPGARHRSRRAVFQAEGDAVLRILQPESGPARLPRAPTCVGACVYACLHGDR